MEVGARDLAGGPRGPGPDARIAVVERRVQGAARMLPVGGEGRESQSADLGTRILQECAGGLLGARPGGPTERGGDPSGELRRAGARCEDALQALGADMAVAMEGEDRRREDLARSAVLQRLFAEPPTVATRDPEPFQAPLQPVVPADEVGEREVGRSHRFVALRPEEGCVLGVLRHDRLVDGGGDLRRSEPDGERARWRVRHPGLRPRSVS